MLTHWSATHHPKVKIYTLRYEFFSEMTVEEQIRVIELKELSDEDESQVYTKIHKNNPENLWNQLLNEKAQQSPLNDMSLIRSTMEIGLAIPYSVPHHISTIPKLALFGCDIIVN